MPSLVTRHKSLVTHNEPATASLWAPLRTQLRVIGALLMREILTRYGRKNIGFLWLFLEPMIITALIAFIWSALRSSFFANISVVAFAVTGYSSVLLWRNMTNRCLKAVEPNRALLYHRSIKIIDLFAARILLEGAGATIAFVALATIFTFFGMMQLPHDALQVVIGWFMLAWFGAGLALVIGPLTQLSPLVEKIWIPISYVSFMFSGALFLVEMLPPAAQQLIMWFPMVSGLEYLREGYFGPVVRFHYDMPYMAVCNMGLMLVGLWQVHLLGRRTIVG